MCFDCVMCSTIWLLKVMGLVSAVLGVYSSILICVHIYILCHFSFSFYTTHTGHLCLEHIELIVAYEYLHPYTAQVNLTVFIFTIIFLCFFEAVLEMWAQISCLSFHTNYIYFNFFFSLFVLFTTAPSLSPSWFLPCTTAIVSAQLGCDPLDRGPVRRGQGTAEPCHSGGDC